MYMCGILSHISSLSLLRSIQIVLLFISLVFKMYYFYCVLLLIIMCYSFLMLIKLTLINMFIFIKLQNHTDQGFNLSLDTFL